MKRRSDDDGISSGVDDRISSSRSRSKIRSNNNNRLGRGTIPPSPAEYAKILKKKKKAEEKAAKIANEAAIAAAEATVFAQKLDEAQAAVVIESEAVAAGVAAGAVLEESPQSIVDGNQPQPWHSLLDNNEDDESKEQQQHNVKKKRRSFWSPSWFKKSTKRNMEMDESFSPQAAAAAVSPTDSEIAAAMDNAPTPTYDRPPPPPPPPMFHTPSATAGLLFGALVNRASAAK
jgi:hypothetical protein